MAAPGAAPGPVKISASLLAADFARLGEEVRALTAAGADAMHVDVMDGHFVPPITLGADVVAALRSWTSAPFDVHLMTAPADVHVRAFADAGAERITFHPEAGPHVHRTIDMIHAAGAAAGLALNPGTPTEALAPVLDILDLVLVMSVNPGYGGQRFLDSQLARIADVRARIDRTGRAIDLAVDGGITALTAPGVIAAGATVLVAGTAVFAGGKTRYADNIQALRTPVQAAATA